MAELKGSLKNGRYPSEQLKTTLSTKKISVSIGGQGTAILTDHSKLTNLEYDKSGHTGFAGIELGTKAEWAAKIDYRPGRGVLVVYTDYQQVIDPVTGEVIDIPSFKIGNGNAYLVDLPFVGDDTRDMLREHIEDIQVHIQTGEREFWNNKLNYNDPEESDLLEFTRD